MFRLLDRVADLARPPKGGAPEDRRPLDLNGRTIWLRVKENPRARRYLLRYDPASGDFVCTVPTGANMQRAIEFTAQQEPWLLAQIEKARPRIALRHGAIVPVRGVDHLITHRPNARGTVWIEPSLDGMPLACVAGEEAHLARRLTDWLKTQARSEVTKRLACHTALLGVTYKRLRISDQKTRWGSCSRSATLSFSWRLIMAPPFVLDYVAAHEAAHLVHMDHSASFWRLVDSLIEDMADAKAWLKAEGAHLYRYGA